MSIDETPRETECSSVKKPSPAELTAEALGGLTVAQIKELATRIPADDGATWGLFERDRRVGVRQLAVRQRRQLQRQLAEQARQERMLEFERRFWGRGVLRVAGVDEAGRGCLAGPVVAAAVILPPEVDLPGLDDSKKLRPEKREQLVLAIFDQATAVGVGRVEEEEIDRINILQASLKAMRLALQELDVEPQQVLIDGNRKPDSPFPEVAIVDGDARSLSIAAASVVAKVHRDRLMIEYADSYPQYGFADHKGYGSAAHLASLREHGPCPLHRRSFGPVAELVGEKPSELFLTFREGLTDSRTREELESFGRFVREGAAELSSEELNRLRQFYRKRLGEVEDVGRRGEEATADFLTEKGYRVLVRRYRGAGGEIDLIVSRAGELVFVEVKTSRQGGLGHPEERVRSSKRERLTRAARHYLLRHADEGSNYRFDVVAVVLSEDQAEITHLENAFQS